MPRKGARVDSFRARDIPFSQVLIERHFRAPVAGDLSQFLYDKPAHMRRRAFLIKRIDPIVSDQGISHRDDLPTIRWVGQYFLITGHGGVETNFADAGTGCAKGFALEISTVFEG